ncbi:unnamed protein product [Symbiodinium sp. CCMP2592]|nr:unnamed protein product [Symbiodinium sp. CCMP2592]
MVVELLHPFSEILQQAKSSLNSEHILRALLARVSDTTALRYLKVVQSFLETCVELGIDLQAMSAVQVIDAVCALQSEPSLQIHSTNTLKALRWLTKVLQLDWCVHSPLLQFFDGPKDRQRKEALPFPLQFAAFLEGVLRSASNSLATRAFAGGVLLLLMSSLRFSDASHVEWRSLSMDGFDLRGLSTRTKTSSNGMPFAATGLGFLGCPDTPMQAWVPHYLWVLGVLWDEMCRQFGEMFCPDTLFFLWDAKEPAFMPMTYAQALYRLRKLLDVCFPGGASASYTLHSAKATMLSWCAEALIAKHVAQVQGHHSGDVQRKYARDDTFLALFAQRTVMRRLLAGWSPSVPIARGAQRPLPNAPLQPVASLSVAASHPYFEYHNADASLLESSVTMNQIPLAGPVCGSDATPVPAESLAKAPVSRDATSVQLSDQAANGVVADAMPVARENSDFSSSEEEEVAEPELGDADEVAWVRSGKGVYHAAIGHATGSMGVRAACGTFLLDPTVSVEPPPDPTFPVDGAGMPDSWAIPASVGLEGSDPLGAALTTGPSVSPGLVASSGASMQQLLSKHQIPAALHETLLEFSSAEFGLVATSLEDLNGFMTTSLEIPTTPSPALTTARLRMLWKECNALALAPAVVPQPTQVVSEGGSDSGWTEVFPKKVSSARVFEMVRQFKSRYPSETLSSDTMPSARLLALVSKQIQDHEWKYIPWKLRMSQELADQASMTRPHKQPRLESLLYDEVPSRELPSQGMGKALMSELLQLQAFAIALCGGAHLHTLKEFNRRFLRRCFEKYPAESNLRPPSVAEAQYAEQHLWSQIATLYNEERWTLDAAIHEVVVLRNELHSQLMPRPMMPKLSVFAQPGRGKGKGTKGKGEGKGGKAGKEGKGARLPTPSMTVQGLRVGLYYMAGQQRRNLCKDFQLGKCTRGKNCRFAHVCGVMDANDRLCLGDHDADGKDFRFAPEVGKQLPGRLLPINCSPLSFDGSLWHGSTDWVGERWVVIAYSLPEVPEGALEGLGFPQGDSVAVTPAQADSSLPSLADAIPSVLPDATIFFLDICSGRNAPLCAAARRLGIPSIRIDLLLCAEHDLLDLAFYERLLRLCFSGRIRMAHGSPPCCEYSRLKLRPGGPPPCRSPEFLQGLPGNDEAAQLRVQQSATILTRVVMLLLATYQAGGHVSLEQPRNCMSWEEPVVQGYLLEVSADVVVVAGCEYGMDLEKHWVFASSWRPLQSLASVCKHPRGTHASYAGVLDSQSGEFASRKTAEFPAKLATAYAEAISPLFADRTEPPTSIAEAALDVSFAQAFSSIPVRKLDSFPRAAQDGGGIYSVPDWAAPPSNIPDVFRSLRADLLQFFAQDRTPVRLRQNVANKDHSPLFTPDQVEALRAIWVKWFRSQGFTQDISWDVATNQPYSLEALHLLAQALKDRDVHLWDALKEGVPIGVDGDIKPSNCFIPLGVSHQDVSDEDFKICSGHWPGAEEDPELLEELMEAELAAGYVEELPSLEAARARWARVAIGKANIIKSEGKSPRLIIDPSVSGTNGACVIPERFLLPGLGDVQHGYPVRGCADEVSAVSLDISAAHKTSRLKEKDRGLMGIKVGNRYFFYRVAPFGASCSAHWWQRLAGFWVRVAHRIVYVSHLLVMYVDDAMLWQAAGAIDMSAVLLLSFCQVFGYPISWRKLQLGPTIVYIGWQIHFRAGAFCLPLEKIAKLLKAIDKVLLPPHFDRRDLESLIGLLHWVLQMAPELRPWLCSLYQDKARPLGTNFSLTQTVWQQLPTYLDKDLCFASTPPGTAIRCGSKLLSVRHVDIHSIDDLRLVRNTGKRLWARIADPTTGKRKLSQLSRQFLHEWKCFCLRPPMMRSLQPPTFVPAVEMAADACASGVSIGIGGWVKFPGQDCLWFSERLTVQDFLDRSVPVDSDANLDIVSYETLAQVGLVRLFASACVGGRMRLQLPAFTDNSGTEAACNKMFTTVQPLAHFVQRLATVAWQSAITLDATHVSGCHNDDADMLSRWDGCSELPDRFQLSYRVDCSMPLLWDGAKDVRIFPDGAFLLWQPPLRAQS